MVGVETLRGHRFSTLVTRLRPTRYPERRVSLREKRRPGPLAGGDPICQCEQ